MQFDEGMVSVKVNYVLEKLYFDIYPCVDGPFAQSPLNEQPD